MFGLIPYRKNLIQAPQSIFDVENLFNSFFRDSFFPTLIQNVGEMKVDIKETDNSYILEADLPGVKKNDLQVEFEDNCLSISVIRDEQVEEKKENYLRRERRYNSISRTFTFENVNQEEISAKYENGVLTVTLPKKEIQSKGRRIQIS